MKSIFTQSVSAVIISSIMVLPLLMMQLINRRNYGEDFPVPLFIILWLLPVLFIVLLNPVVRYIRSGKNIRLSPAGIWLRAAGMLLVGYVWIRIIADQMPCFLGVVNCD